MHAKSEHVSHGTEIESADGNIVIHSGTKVWKPISRDAAKLKPTVKTNLQLAIQIEQPSANAAIYSNPRKCASADKIAWSSPVSAHQTSRSLQI